MPCKCARYDAAGNRILSREDMIKYYQQDKSSLDIVTRWMPFKYVVYPDIEIRIGKNAPGTVTVIKIYPGETKEQTFEVSNRAMDGLRNTWTCGKGWQHKNGTGYVSLRFPGRVVPDPLKRFGIW